ncbi:MAG: Hsp20/alpha crystallin family protein [Rhodobacteraceae bacterium]|nr:Hsp20/alpha crystallin family protein [Paracoccaceae bacterium]
MAERIIPPFGGFVVYPDAGGNIFERMFGSGHKPEKNDEPSAMTPLVDIYEDENAVTITTDLPGVRKEDVQVSITDGTLSINAEAHREEHQGGHWIKHERRSGTYVRTLHMSGNVDPGSISANLSEGVLRLTIAKPKSTEFKKIEIDVT